jgi:hypothetical protein
MPSGHPVLFVFRVGAVLLLLAALSVVPAPAAVRCSPLGRVSLTVYALHVAVIYGWSTHDGLVARIGPVLPPARALLLAAAVLLGSVTVALALASALRTLRSVAPGAFERGADLAVALLRGARGAGER